MTTTPDQVEESEILTVSAERQPWFERGDLPLENILNLARREALRVTEGNAKAAAKLLGINRTSMSRAINGRKGKPETIDPVLRAIAEENRYKKGKPQTKLNDSRNFNLDHITRMRVEMALAKHNNNQGEASRELDINRATLFRLKRKFATNDKKK